ncbi:hypothetical protein HY212_07860 [Candidatus Pacearchaeota archaeon]|nr:hypothetical protein [Candidatus Pacearchaeota archaeon]
MEKKFQNKNWFKRHPIWDVIIIILIVGIFWSALKGTVPDKIVQNVPDSAVNEQKEVPGDAYSNAQDQQVKKGEGYERVNPTTFNNSLKTTLGVSQIVTAEYTLLSLIRGEEAWKIIEKENQFNSPPSEGKEYILVKMRFHLISTSDNKAYEIPWTIFTAISEDGIGYDGFDALVLPEPYLLGKEVFPGATYEGWFVVEVKKNDKKPVLRISYPGVTDELWFKLY